jgi:probable phosphoglycerate mutase
MTVYFIRHGESEANAQGVTAGQSESPLTSRGRTQAHAAALQLQTKNIHIDTIISSPLQRAFDTATIIADELQYSDEITINPLIIERSLGTLQGKSAATLHGMSASEQAAAGVETDAEVMARARELVAELQRMPQGNLLLVSHSGFGRRLIALVKEVEVESVPKLPNADVIALCSSEQLSRIEVTPVDVYQ